MGPEAWARVRAIRLRALADAPDAFATTLAEDEARPPEAWRERLVAPEAATFLVRRRSEDVGLVVGADSARRDGAAGLFAMWVAPEARGAGVGDALVHAVVAWARERGYERVALEVADGNQAAIALYERHGFQPTGRRGTLPAPRDHIGEHELELRL